MKRLTIIYDDQCGFCCRCRDWLEKQPQLVQLEFIPGNSESVQKRFPNSEIQGSGEEFLVVSDDGGLYRGVNAYIMCLYALENYREWSFQLSHPSLLPLARQFFWMISKRRLSLSKILRLKGEPQNAVRLAQQGPAQCVSERSI